MAYYVKSSGADALIDLILSWDILLRNEVKILLMLFEYDN